MDQSGQFWTETALVLLEHKRHLQVMMAEVDLLYQQAEAIRSGKVSKDISKIPERVTA